MERSTPVAVSPSTPPFLPVEILIKVLFHLSKRDLDSCMMVNNNMHDIVAPQLYHALSIKDISMMPMIITETDKRVSEGTIMIKAEYLAHVREYIVTLNDLYQAATRVRTKQKIIVSLPNLRIARINGAQWQYTSHIHIRNRSQPILISDCIPGAGSRAHTTFATPPSKVIYILGPLKSKNLLDIPLKPESPPGCPTSVIFLPQSGG
jgi:hypothetical protein